MTDRSVPVDALPGEWWATGREHPEAPSSAPIATREGGTTPPYRVYDVRRNVTLRFGVAVEVYDVHGAYHLYPRSPMGSGDALLYVYEADGDAEIRFGNRTRRIHLHGNTTDEIKNGQVHNDAIGIVVHRADGRRDIVRGNGAPTGRGTASE